jgi:alpha-1,2-mannosyltransferase
VGRHDHAPPFAALVFVSLALVPIPLAEMVTPALSCAGLVLLWRRLDLPAGLLVLVPLSLLLEPVWATLHFGQVNLVLMVAVPLDLSRTGGRTHGIWAGVAAGIKLTPLVFAAQLVVTRQWRALVRFLAAFAVTVTVPLLVAPGDVVRFWTSVLPDSGRIGAPWFALNQSTMGALARIGAEEAWVRPAWFLVASALTLACLALARALWLRGDLVAATSAVGLASLLASPVSWSHHWVWVVPMAWTLVRWGNSRIALAWLAVFFVAPHLWLPRGDDLELAWTWQHLPGNAYALAGLFWLGYLAARIRTSAVAAQHQPAGRHAGAGGDQHVLDSVDLVDR